MKIARPLAVLFGAGATRGGLPNGEVKPPLDVDLFDVAGQIKGRGTRRLAQRVVRDVFDINRKVSSVGLELYYRDIETRWELSRFARSKNRPKDWKIRTEDLEELVRRVLIHTTCELDEGPAKPRVSSAHRAILGALRAGDSILTFNYDTLIEESMPDNAPLWTPRGGYGVEVSGITNDWARRWFSIRGLASGAASKVMLLKLHGSINWTLYETAKVRLKGRPYVVRSNRGKPVFDKAAILPPGWHKRVDRQPYSTLWASARLKLEKCAALIVIGYSLPETDLIARALFHEVSRLRAARGSFLKELHVADTSSAARDRIVNLFAPALGATGTVSRYDGIEPFAKAMGDG